MDQGTTPPEATPPAAPPPVPSAPPPPAGRPGVITGVGVLAIIRAILLSLLALALFNASSIAGDAGLAGIAGGATTWAIVMVVMVVLYIVGGIQVLRLREQGRIIMMVVAGLDIAIGLYFMTAVRGGANILGLALDAFIIYACVSQKDAFSKS